ncbi:MAG TPA: peptidase M23, partial [Salinimicrobium sp.]|nr:peptidase M23 [Salinimicrobium sp.]
MKIKIFPHFFLFIFLLINLPGFSQTDERQELERRRQELQQEIKRINSLRTSNLSKERSILTEVADLNQQIRTTENLIKVTNQQANLLTRQINSNQKKIGELREELKKLKEDYARMIRKSYKSKSQQSRIMFLLSSESFLQAYKRLQYMKQYTNYRKQQGDEIRARTELLQELNQSLAEQKKTKDALIAENRVTRAKLEKDRQAQQGLISTIRKKESQYAAELREKQRAVDKIDAAIEEIIAAAIAANNKKSGSTSRDVFELTPEAKALAAEFASNRGKLPWPVRSGVISMHFGKQQHPVVKSITINSNGVRLDTENGGK